MRSVRKLASTTRSVAATGKKTSSRARGTSNVHQHQRSTSGARSISRSSTRHVSSMNNSAVRHGRRSSSIARGSHRGKKSLAPVGAEKRKRSQASRSMAKKKTKSTSSSRNQNQNNQRRPLTQRDQPSELRRSCFSNCPYRTNLIAERTKKSSAVSSLLSSTTSTLIRPDDEFHRESNFNTNE